MAWFKVDDQLAFNSKVMLAGNSAMGLWVRAGSWSSAQLTAGFIPHHMANAMANAMATACESDALVSAGLWDEVDGGYQFHDWADFQPDAEAEKQKRKATAEARSAAGKAGAEARWGKESDGKPHGKRNGKSDESHGKPHGKPMASEWQTDAPVPSRPVPTRPTPKGVVKARDISLPDSWEPTADHAARATETGLDVNREETKFRAHAEEKGRKAKSWNAAFTRWLMQAAEYAERDNARSKGKLSGDDKVAAGLQLSQRLATQTNPHQIGQ